MPGGMLQARFPSVLPCVFSSPQSRWNMCAKLWQRNVQGEVLFHPWNAVARFWKPSLCQLLVKPRGSSLTSKYCSRVWNSEVGLTHITYYTHTYSPCPVMRTMYLHLSCGNYRFHFSNENNNFYWDPVTLHTHTQVHVIRHLQYLILLLAKLLIG